MPQLVHQLGGLLQQVHGGQAGGRVGRGDGAGEEEGPRFLPHIVHDDLLAGDDAPHHPEGLGQRPNLHVELAVQAKVVHDAPALAQHPLAVGIVHHGHQPVPLGDLVELVQGGDVAVHREHPIGDQQPPAVVPDVLLDHPLAVGRVAVLVDDDFGPREAATVNDGGVVQPVGEDDVALAHQGRDGRLVGAQPRLDVQRVLYLLELGQPLLQLEVQRLGASDGAHGRWPHPPLLDGLLGRFFDLGMVGQAQVIVGAKVEHLFAVHHHPGVGR